jgi:NADH dehydrogenase [ubiquinone] 1 alpha subcomplex assembly factor 1
MDQAQTYHVIFDFERPGASPWSAIDDVVMGGISHSSMRIENGRAVFAGVVSLEQGGGFASVRSAPGPWDLSRFGGIEMVVRGDGRRYKLRLKTDPRFDSLNWQARFQTAAAVPLSVRLPFREFEPVYRGKPVADVPVLDTSRIQTFGLLISDRQAGPFRLEIERIAAFR